MSNKVKKEVYGRVKYAGHSISEGVSDVLFQNYKQRHIKGKTAEFDTENNGSFQLVIASQILSKFKTTIDDTFEPHFGWDEEQWSKMVQLPYDERLAIASALLIAELDRIKAMKEGGLEFDPLKV